MIFTTRASPSTSDLAPLKKWHGLKEQSARTTVRCHVGCEDLKEIQVAISSRPSDESHPRRGEKAANRQVAVRKREEPIPAPTRLRREGNDRLENSNSEFGRSQRGVHLRDNTHLPLHVKAETGFAGRANYSRNRECHRQSRSWKLLPSE